MGGEMTIEVLKITYPNKDQSGIKCVCFYSGSSMLPIESWHCLHKHEILKSYEERTRFRICWLFGGSELNLKISESQCWLADSQERRWLIGLSPCQVRPVLSPASVNMHVGPYAMCGWTVSPFLLYLALLSAWEEDKRDLRLGSG